HLSVTLDDHLQGVTLVTRGTDLFASTHVHRVLQALLGLTTPEYHHHRIVTDAAGARLAKRAGAATLPSLREAGCTPADVRAMVAFGYPGGGCIPSRSWSAAPASQSRLRR